MVDCKVTAIKADLAPAGLADLDILKTLRNLIY